MKAQVTLANCAISYHEGASKSYSAILQSLVFRYVTDDTIANWDAEMSSLRKRSMVPAK